MPRLVVGLVVWVAKWVAQIKIIRTLKESRSRKIRSREEKKEK